MRFRPSLLLIGMLAACGSSPPARYAWGDGGYDASSAKDAGGSADAASRPDGSTLPVADVTVVAPYGAGAVTTQLTLRAAPPQLDVHLSVDTTGSFHGEIAELQRSLVSVVVPGIRAKVPDTSFGVSRFEDFPTLPFGQPTDRPFRLVTGVTNDSSRVTAALAGLSSLGNGADTPESDFEALFQIATGIGYVAGGQVLVTPYARGRLPGGGTLGGVGFRDGAFHAIVHVTDAPAHEPSDYAPAYIGVHGFDDVVAALAPLDAHVIGIASGADARPQLENLANVTHTTMPATAGTCPTGLGGAPRPASGSVCPLVFDVAPDGTGLSSTLLTSLIALVDGITWTRAGSTVSDDRLGFVRSIRAATAAPPPGAPNPTTADLSPIDGVPDTFIDVHSSTDLTFEVAIANDLFPDLDYEQIFRVTVALVADGRTIDTTTIRIVVPAKAPIASDAGVGTP